VLTYIPASFANRADAVFASEVAKVRKSIRED